MSTTAPTSPLPFQQKRRFAVLSLVVSTVLVGAKFWAWRLTHSQVVLSDALESIANIATSGFALWSVWLASLPRDENHPYGHGKAESLSVGLEGALIFGAGIFIVASAAGALRHPHPIRRPDLGLALLTATAVVNLLTGYWLKRAGQRLRSAALVGDGNHLYIDALTSLVAAGALLAVWFTRRPLLDPLAAFVLGAFITWQGWKMLRRAAGGLLDETDPAVVAALVETLEANRRRIWIDVHNLRTQTYGPALHVDCHVSLPYYLTLYAVHREMDELSAVVRAHGPAADAELSIHFDPCQPPRQCPHCAVQGCPVREADFQSLIPWTPENVMRNERHGAPRADA